jgi:TRAP-type C4-dicarboxylate transport system substrate-binding protein
MRRRTVTSARIGVLMMLLATLCLLLAACGGNEDASATGAASGGNDPQDVIEIRFQTVIPASGADYTQHFVDLVNEMSGGRIKVTAYQSDQLVPSMEMLNAVQAGTLDMAETVAGMHSQITTGPLLSGVPFAAYSELECVALFQEFQDGKLMQLLGAEFEANGAHFLGPIYSGSLALLTTRQINSPADLKGLKVAALDPTSSSFLEKIGCAAEFIAPEEIYTSIQNGTADGTLYASPGLYQQMGMSEVAQYMTVPYPVYGAPMSMIINAAIWDSLSADLQAVLEGATEAYCKYMLAAIYLADQQALATGDVINVPMTEELTAHMEQAARQVWEELGGISPQAGEALAIIKEWQTLMGR